MCYNLQHSKAKAFACNSSVVYMDTCCYYLIRWCAGPKDEVPGEILPREVESSSRRRLAMPWRHKKQLERQEGEDVPADTRRGPHVSRVSNETWPLPRSLPLALLPCGLFMKLFSVYNQHGWMIGTGCTFFFWSNRRGWSFPTGYKVDRVVFATIIYMPEFGNRLGTNRTGISFFFLFERQTYKTLLWAPYLLSALLLCRDFKRI